MSSNPEMFEYMNADAAIYAWRPTGKFPKARVKFTSIGHEVIRDHFSQVPNSNIQ